VGRVLEFELLVQCVYLCAQFSELTAVAGGLLVHVDFVQCELRFDFI